jgi:hypothetical protein
LQASPDLSLFHGKQKISQIQVLLLTLQYSRIFPCQDVGEQRVFVPVLGIMSETAHESGKRKQFLPI